MQITCVYSRLPDMNNMSHYSAETNNIHMIKQVHPPQQSLLFNGLWTIEGFSVRVFNSYNL